MLKYVLKRLLWVVPSLIGISLVTFVLMELAPGDRALVNLDQRPGTASAEDIKVRQERARGLEIQYGLRDPHPPHERYSVGYRYLRWLGRAVMLDFAGTAVDRQLFRERLQKAVPVTLLLNALALLFGLAVAIPLGAYVGMRIGGSVDRAASTCAFVLFGLPEFLIATLLVLVFGGGFFGEILPVGQLHSGPVAGQSVMARLLDLIAHLLLPVFTLALGYGVVVFRFLRSSVARAASSDFVVALRGWGMSDKLIRGRVLKNGLSPLVTLLGTMLPSLITGTVVVETIFSLPGLGRLSYEAVLHHDYPMVMALTMLVGLVTLLSLILSDVLQRVVDPRVQLR
ncbi:MAG: ABC transporter permease [Planctomycetota bacterium]|jgi:peptide/nickel transport system permease protein